jgi:hypothetical protein
MTRREEDALHHEVVFVGGKRDPAGCAVDDVVNDAGGLCAWSSWHLAGARKSQAIL